MTYLQRTLLMAPAGLIGLVLAQSPAQATQYPYCMTYNEGWSGAIERCDFSTMAQCQATASGLNGYCMPNWRLAYGRGDSSVPDTPVSKRHRY